MIDNLNNIFSNYTPYINGWENFKRASVTIPLVNYNNSLHILFEVRSKTLRNQPNEVCFPGGKIEKDEKTGRYLLKKSVTDKKDQTYALYNLTQEQLEHTLLPIGDYEKERVREIAKEIGIDVHNKPDSQEICFVKDNDYAGYVKKHSKKRIEEGYFVDTKGNVLGKHKGIVNYTIGQRKGLGIAFGKPMFVIDINAKKNTVVLGDNEDLFNKVVIAKDVNLIAFDEITEPVRGASLIGKGSEVLMEIDMVSDNLAQAEGMCGSKSGSIPVNVGQPMIRVKEITVGGRSEE